MATRLAQLGPRLATLDHRRVAPPPKQVDPHYESAEHRDWRAKVLTRAGYRCEALDARGQRCRKGAPTSRLFADHKTEIRDGGDALDPANGQCLCGSHHTAKTAEARAARRGEGPWAG